MGTYWDEFAAKHPREEGEPDAAYLKRFWEWLAADPNCDVSGARCREATERAAGLAKKIGKIALVAAVCFDTDRKLRAAAEAGYAQDDEEIGALCAKWYEQLDTLRACIEGGGR